MRRRSDLWILALCSVPVIITLGLFMNYEETGSLPGYMSGISMPLFSLPSVPTLERYLPAGSGAFLQTAHDNLGLFLAGGAVAALVLVMLLGAFSDLLTRHHRPAVEGPAIDGRVDDPFHAPWLNGGEEEE